MIKVIVGSKSEHKLLAVKRAFADLKVDAEVIGVDTKSGVNEQPFGMHETSWGALNRAKKSITTREAEGATMTLGIESGLLTMAGCVLDVAVIALVVEGQEILGTSPGVPFERQDYETASRKGFETNTIGQAMAERLGSSATDPTTQLTGGRYTRADQICEGVKVVLSRWLAMRDGGNEREIRTPERAKV